MPGRSGLDAPPARDPIYSGIFASEPGQALLDLSTHQINHTYRSAWDACRTKHDPATVFGQCMELVATWNEKVFEQEATAMIERSPKAGDVLKRCFVAYASDITRPLSDEGDSELHVTVPPVAVYVQALLRAAATDTHVSRGEFFVATALDRAVATMAIVRRALSVLADDYVYTMELSDVREGEFRGGADGEDATAREAVREAAPGPTREIRPSDSVSNAGSRRSARSARAPSHATSPPVPGGDAGHASAARWTAEETKTVSIATHRVGRGADDVDEDGGDHDEAE